MGAVCAVVYLLSLIVFIPFAFYKDIVAATSGGGNRDVVIEVQQVETGRFLHRFPHGKVCTVRSRSADLDQELILTACVLPLGSSFPAVHRHPRDWR